MPLYFWQSDRDNWIASTLEGIVRVASQFVDIISNIQWKLGECIQKFDSDGNFITNRPGP